MCIGAWHIHVYVCDFYACICGCMYLCMQCMHAYSAMQCDVVHVCMHVCRRMHVCMHVRMRVLFHGCMHVCGALVHVCM